MSLNKIMDKKCGTFTQLTQPLKTEEGNNDICR